MEYDDLLGVRFGGPSDSSGEAEAVKDIAIRVELKAVESSIFLIISPANEKFVSEYVIENRSVHYWPILSIFIL